MSNQEIPIREAYGTPNDEALRCYDPYEVIDDYIQNFCAPIDEDSTMVLVCANLKRDQDGELIKCEHDDSLYELTDEAEVTLNIREWCRENDAMELLDT